MNERVGRPAEPATVKPEQPGKLLQCSRKPGESWKFEFENVTISDVNTLTRLMRIDFLRQKARRRRQVQTENRKKEQTNAG